MKKLLSLTLAMMLSVTTAYGAPHARRNEIKFGAKLKPHFARFWIEEEVTGGLSTSAFRPSGGIFGEYAFNDTIGGQLSLEYSRQGAANSQAKDDNYDVSDFNYVMLTTVSRFYTDKNRQFCVFVGPQLSVLATAKERTYNSKGEKVGDVVDVLAEGYPYKPKRINFGILLGLDYEFDNGILLGYESNIGFREVIKIEDLSYTTLSAGLTIGYNFAKLS